MPQAYWIIPLEAGHIDNSLPGGPPGHVGGGPVYPGHPANRPPGSWGGPVDPGFGWGGGEHPGNRPPGSWTGDRPDNTLPETMPQGGTEVPEDVYTPAPIPEEIISQYVVTVYNPKTQTYTTKTYPPR